MQASEREGTRRNRNRPTDWWTAAPSPVVPPVARVQIPPKKPDQALRLRQNNGNLNSKKDGSGPKHVGGKKTNADIQYAENNQENDEAGKDGVEAATLLMNGRTSGSRGQNRAEGTHKEAKSRKSTSSKKTEPQPRTPGESSSSGASSTRHGRPANIEAELRKPEHDRLNDSSRLPLTEVIASNRPASGTRRGRSSNTEAELQEHVNYKERRTYKRQQPSNTNNHVQVDILQDIKKKQNTKSTVEVKSVVPKVSGRLSNTGKQAKSRSSVTGSQTSVPRKVSNRQQEGVDDRQRLSQGQLHGKRKPIEDPPQSPSSKRRRHGHLTQEQEQRLDAHPRNKHPKYQQLAPVTRRVSRRTIDTKWDALPQPCIEQISQLLQEIQRPVVVRLTDERRRSQASSALQMISRKLVRKISKGLPFPSGPHSHREDDFDLEKILDHSRALELQLTPALHANELLEAELDKERILLASEETQLADLETNAKAEAARRRQDQRKVHSLLQPGHPSDADFEDRHGFKLHDSPKSLYSSLRDDKELQLIVQDLEGHVESIDLNLKQVKGIPQAIAKSKAALQAALFQSLDNTQYCEAVLG